MIEVEEVDTNVAETPQDFPTLEELNRQRNEILKANGQACANEINAALGKYNMRISWRTTVEDNKITENVMIIIPR